MNKIYIDFETRSTRDILKTGMYRYLNDPNAGVLCMSYMVVDVDGTVHPPKKYKPTRSERSTGQYTPPQEFKQLVDEGALLIGHNVMFEYECIKRFFKWDIPLAQFHCTMDLCRYNNIPASLERSLQALKADVVKDLENKKMLELFCTPKVLGVNGMPIWNEPEDFPEDFEKLNIYCDRDTECSYELDKRLPQLPPFERAVQIHTWATNNRGVHFDKRASQQVLDLMDPYIERMSAELSRLTNGAIAKPTQTVALKKYINETFKLKISGVDKATISYLLDNPTTPKKLKEILKVRQACSSSAIAKLRVVLEQGEDCGPTINVRGALNYSGAITNRFSSYGVQLHNFPRPVRGHEYQDALEFIQYLNTDPEIVSTFFPDLATITSGSLRAFIRPRETTHTFIQCDLANIEARGLAYLARQEDLLEAFRQGTDTYKLTYSKLAGVPLDEVTKAQRDVGKVVQLSLGYGGGVDALLGMAAGYGVDVRDFVYNVFFDTHSQHVLSRSSYKDLIVKPRWYKGDFDTIRANKNREEIEALLKSAQGKPFILKKTNLYTTFTDDLINSFIHKWRETHSGITEMWRECERLAMDVLRDGKPRHWRTHSGTHLFSFARVGEHTLHVVFPTGTKLTYRGAKIEGNKITYLNPGTGAALFTRKTMTTGGFLVENITQAWARNVFCHYLIQIQRQLGLVPDFHVHDEGVFAVPLDKAEALREKVEAIMSVPPAWAIDAPIGADAGLRERFWK